MHSAHGTVVIDENGNWTFTANNQHHDIQALGVGDTLTEVVTVTSKDGTAHQDITITINGKNDIPTIGGSSTGGVKEDATSPTLETSGQLTIRDIDAGESAFKTDADSITQGSDTWGGLTLDSSGKWTYSVDNEHRVQTLQEGVTHTDTFTVHSLDGTAHKVQVTITGTKDAPVISVTGHDSDSSAVIEKGSKFSGQKISGTESASGHLTATDIDAGDSQTWSIVSPLTGHAAGDGVYGHLSVDTSGQWAYTLDNDRSVTQALIQGQQVTESFTVRVTDKTGLTVDHQVTIDVTGSNDQAEITGQDTGRVKEEAIDSQHQNLLYTSGVLMVHDVDNGEDHFKAGTVQGLYGSLTLDANGNWHYKADNSQTAIQELKATDSLTDTITVHSADGTEHKVVITIDGTNDLPVIADTGDSGGVVEAGSHPDSHRHPEAEIGTPSVSGTLTATETDKGDPAHWAVTNGQGTYGSLAIDPQTGRWTYRLDNTRGHAADRLQQGEVVKEVFEVTDTDSSGTPVKHSVEITVTGSNDVPVIKGTHTGAVTEAGGTANANAGTPSIAGDLTATDLDNNDGTLTWSVDGATTGTETRVGKYGTFTIDQNGHWNYQLDNSGPDTQKLQSGQTPTETFMVLVTDSLGKPVEQEVTVTVHGTNDDPVLAAYSPQYFSEGTGRQHIRLPKLVDVDDTTHTYRLGHGHPGWMSIDSDGKIEIRTGVKALDYLAAGEIKGVDVDVIVEDPQKGSTKQTVHLNIVGTNDRPVLKSVEITDLTNQVGTSAANPHRDLLKTHTNFGDNLHLEEDQKLSGTVHFTDVDRSDSHTVRVIGTYTYQDAQGKHVEQLTRSDLLRAGFEIHDDGTFTLNAGAEKYQGLQIGEQGKLDVQTEVDDHNGGVVHKSLHFIIHGQEDKPVVRQMPALVTNEDTNLKFTATDLLGDHNQNVRDPDGDPLALFNVHVEDGHGHIIDHGNGNYEFVPDANYHGTVHIGYTVTDGRVDGQGHDITTQVTGWPINVIPVNDAPAQVHSLVAKVAEDSGDLIITEDQLRGLLNDIDDTSAKLVVSNLHLTDSNAGKLVDNQNGTWTFTPAQDFNTRHAGPNGYEKLVGLTFDYTDAGTSAFGQSGTQSGSYSGTAHIKVTPVGDAAIITAPQGGIGVTAETGHDIAAAQLGITDPDWQEQQFQTTSTIRGTYGFATIDKLGHLEYHLNLKDPAVLALGGGQHLTETVTVTAKDGTTKDIDIDITGTNQAPQITLAAPIRATESNQGDPITQVTGSFKAIDPDAGDHLAFSCKNPPDGLIVNADGSYSFYTASPAYNHLKEGEVQTLTFDLTVTDGTATTTKPVSLIVTGTNDAPVISSPLPVGQIHHGENHLSFDQDLLIKTATDPDGDILHVLKVGTQHTEVTVLDKSLGHIEEDGQGGYTFYPSQTALGHTGGKNVTISYTVTDGRETATGHMIVHVDQHAQVNTNHPNPHHSHQNQNVVVPPQQPVDVIHGDIAGEVTEEGESTKTGSGAPDSREGHVTANSPNENPHGVTGSNHIEGSNGYGYATVVPGTSASDPGHWTYHLYKHDGDSDPINQLAEGEKLQETFTITSNHGGSQVITMTIHGTNDKPVITGETHVQVSDLSGSNSQILPDWQTNHIVEVDTMQIKGEIEAKDVDGDHLTFGVAPSSGHPALQGFSITSDGHYTYQPSNSDPLIKGLAPGQTKDVTAWVQVNDGHGGVVDTPVHFTVHGRNAAPTADSKVDLQHSDEDQAVNLHSTPVSGSHSGQGLDLVGLANAQDADGDKLYVTNIQQTGQSHGKFQDFGHGNYKFIPDQDFHGDVVFTYEITDGLASTTVTATLHVDSVNDKPTVTKLTRVTDEDTAIKFTEQDIIGSGMKGDSGVVKDPDFATDGASEHLSLSNVHLKDPSQGTLTHDGQGGYTFTPATNFNGKVELEYTVTDSLVDANNGPHLSTNGVVEITVNPVNDIPTFKDVTTDPTKEHVKEDAAGLNAEQIASGHLQITDADTGEGHFVANSHIAGKYGYLEIDRDGNWQYHLMKNYAKDVQALGDGDVFQESFTLHTRDGAPDKTTYDLTVDIQGTNDGATISGHATGTATSTVSDSVTEQLGLDPLANSPAQLTTATGTLQVHDVDKGENGFEVPKSPLTPTGPGPHYGTLMITKGGDWTYTVDNNRRDAQQLHENEQIEEHFTVTSIDGTATQEIVVTLVGKNNAPVIEGVTAVSINEGKSNGIAGDLKAHDIDNDAGTITFGPQPGETLPDGFVLDANGHYTFDATHGSYDYLKAGEQVTVVAHVVATDNHNGVSVPKDIEIVVTGTNDAAEIKGPDSVTVVDSPTLSDTFATAQQQLQVTDKDHDEASFKADAHIQPDNTTAGTGLQQTPYGHVEIDKDGNWQYHVDTPDAVKAIPDGQHVTESFTVYSKDGTSHTVSVTLSGVNEAATISGGVTGAVTEDGTISASGTLSVADIDNGEDHFQSGDIVGTFGTLHLSTYGQWHYDLDAAKAQSLTQGDTQTDTIPVQSADGTTHNVVITVKGTNDTAVIAGDTHEAVTSGLNVNSNGELHTSGILTVVDPDHGEAKFQAQPQQGTYGTFNLKTNGHWSYNAANNNHAIKALAAGATLTETFTVMAKDGTAHDVTVTIHGANDAPTVSSVVTLANADEDETGIQITQAQLLQGASDVEGDSLSVGTVTADHGTVTKVGDHWNFTPQANYHGPVVFSYQVQDGNGGSVAQTATMQLVSINDVPVVAHIVTLPAGDEDQVGIQIVDADLLQGASDADGDNLDISGLTVDHGSVSEQSGHWVYTPEANYHGPVVFSYQIQDGNGGSVAQSATMHLAAVNDKPVITEVSQGMVSESSLSGTAAAELSVQDPDGASEQGFLAETGLHGTYGTLGIDEHGHWGYTLTDKQNPAVKALNVGDTLVDTLTVHTKDGTEYDVHVTITGENDAPTVSGSVPLGNITQDSPVTLVKAALLASVTDPDNTDADLMISQLTAQHAKVTDNHDGTWTVTPDKGFTGDIQFSYNVEDGNGGNVPATASLHVDTLPSQPAPPPPTADEPMLDAPVETVTLEALASNHAPHTGAQAYLDQLGINEPQHQSGDQALPQDLDLVLNSDKAPVLDEHGLIVADADGAETNSADDHHKHHDDLLQHDHSMIVHYDWTENHA
ncbi:VCBS domain-containing protein [Vibrio superstes]|uniref:VCBS domain-containing protein n=1 Tax=Vibrio superstes TaxID=198815 RepID=UPI001C99CE04|nr:VCBS domain-containing protein [Vibrio superstes]